MLERTVVSLSIHVKEWFFDPEAVLEPAAKAKRSGLSKGGAFIRRRAQSLLRRRKRVSQPGETPSVHALSGEKYRTLRFILFGFDGEDSVITGPVGFNQKFDVEGSLLAGTVPNTLEFGRNGVGIREKLENISPTALKRVTGKKRRKKGAKRQLTDRQIAAIRRKRIEAAKREQFAPGVKWVPVGKKKLLPGQPMRVRRANYVKRPFMGPSLEMERDNFPELFENSVVAAS